MSNERLSEIHKELDVFSDCIAELSKSDLLKYPSWTLANEFNNLLNQAKTLADNKDALFPPTMTMYDVDRAVEPYLDLKMALIRLRKMLNTLKLK